MKVNNKCIKSILYDGVKIIAYLCSISLTPRVAYLLPHPHEHLTSQEDCYSHRIFQNVQLLLWSWNFHNDNSMPPTKFDINCPSGSGAMVSIFHWTLKIIWWYLTQFFSIVLLFSFAACLCLVFLLRNTFPNNA